MTRLSGRALAGALGQMKSYGMSASAPKSDQMLRHREMTLRANRRHYVRLA